MAKGAEKPSDKGEEIKVRIKDVARPDETAPDNSSRPIIVTNRPIMRDTMVNEPEAEEGGPKKSELSRTTREAVIQPADSTATETPETAKTEPKDAAETTAETVKPEENTPPPKPQEKPPEPEEPSAEQESSTKENDETEDAQEKDKPKSAQTADEAAAADEAEAKKLAEHDAAIQKLADSKKYELPINALEKRRSKHVAIIGLVLSVLLLLAWADIAIDAGILHINGVKPLTHFFNN